MIININKLKEITGCDYYDGSIIHSRFAYKFFRDKTHPIGDIVSFISPAKVETQYMVDLEDVLSKDFIYSEKMVHFCFEIPTTNLWGGVAFQRLFNTTIGNILAETLQTPFIEVDGDDIFIRQSFDNKGITILKGKASVSIATEKQGAILGHTGINIIAGEQAPAFAYSTRMSDKEAEVFQNKCINAFYQMTHSIFMATTKVL